jgi:hypothetical protein
MKSLADIIFKRQTLLFLLTLFGTAGVALFFLGKTDPSVQKEYHKLVESSKAGMELSRSPKTTTQQQTDVRRDIFFSKGNEKDNDNNKLQLCLTGESAEVVVVAQGKKFEVLERSRNVSGILQEEIYYSNELAEKTPVPMQQILQFEAEEATYSYENNLFVAHNVQLFRYSARNHKLEDADDKKLEMSGYADSMEFSLANETNEIKLEKLNATFYPR